MGVGKTAKQSRPMAESDSVHITGIAETSEGRLSYPQFLLYDPNYPDSPYEDVHYAGQIVSHYLVALQNPLRINVVFLPSQMADMMLQHLTS